MMNRIFAVSCVSVKNGTKERVLIFFSLSSRNLLKIYYASKKTALSGYIFATMAEQLTLLQSGNWHRSKLLKKVENLFGGKTPLSKSESVQKTIAI